MNDQFFKKQSNSSETEKMQKLAEQKKQIERQMVQMRAKAISKNRREEDRRKILLGAMMIHEITSGNVNREAVLKKLNSYLTRPMDRELFGLQPIPPDDARTRDET